MKRLKKFLQTSTGLYVLLGVLGLLMLISTKSVLIPTFEGILAKRADLTKKKAQLTSLREKQDFLSSLDTNGVMKYLPEAEIALPSEKDAISAISAIENLSQVTQVGLSSLTLTPGVVSTPSSETKKGSAQAQTSHKGVPTLPVSVVLIGKNEQLLDFMHRLESTRRLFDVESFSYKSDSQGVLTVTLNLDAYFLPPPNQIGAVDAPLAPWTEEDRVFLEKIANFAKSDTVSQTPASATVRSTDLFTR